MDKKYANKIRRQMKKAKNILVEKPEEIADQIIGLELWEFDILSGKDDDISEEAFCADEEILMIFQGKEMRIYVEDGKLCVYTD